MAGAIAGQVFDFEVADFASLPADNAPDTEGRLVRAADTGLVYRDDGGGWNVWSSSLQLGSTGTTAAAGNHTHTHADVTDFDTQVRTSTLNQLAAPSADLSINSHKLTNVTDPTGAQDAATKAYVDAAVLGLAWKQSVRVATTANATLATAFENGDTVDGVTLATGDRILLKNQSSGAENGIYTVNASGAPTRATDADSAADILQASMYVREGTANADTLWTLTTNAPITLNTTALTFAQLSTGTSLSEGSGIDITGGVVSVDIPSLTADASPDGAADYVLAYDASASAHKKVLLDDLPGASGGGGGGGPVLRDQFGVARYAVREVQDQAVDCDGGETITLAELTGSGTVLALNVIVDGSGPCWDGVVKVYYDGEEDPGIVFDLGTLGIHFQTGAKKVSTRNVSVEIDGGEGWSGAWLRFPIPFGSGLRVDFTNPTATFCEVYYNVLYTPDVTQTRRLRSAGLTFLNKDSLTPGGDPEYDFLNLPSGAGTLVWHSLAADAATANTFMEPNVVAYVDGEGTAGVQTSGTEDWFGNTFYFLAGETQSPWALCGAIDLTLHQMAAGLDLLEYCGGIRYSDGVRLAWQFAESTTNADISFLVLYYDGDDPATAPGLVWRGDWDTDADYLVNDAVQHEGSSYIATAASTGGAPPSADWALLAEKGDQGPSGGHIILDDAGDPLTDRPNLQIIVGSSGATLADDAGDNATVLDLSALTPPGGGGGLATLLDYHAAADIANGLSVPATTWTTLLTDQSFTVSADEGDVLIAVGGLVLVGGSGTLVASVRLVVDSGGTPVNRVVCGQRVLASAFENALAGAVAQRFAGLAAGGHTARIQVYATSAATAYCLPATAPNSDSLHLLVQEVAA